MWGHTCPEFLLFSSASLDIVKLSNQLMQGERTGTGLVELFQLLKIKRKSFWYSADFVYNFSPPVQYLKAQTNIMILPCRNFGTPQNLYA